MEPNLSSSGTSRVRVVSRVLSEPAMIRRYRHLKLAGADLVQFLIYDYAKSEQRFVLGDVVRYLRDIYPVPIIYRTMTALLKDGWFILEQSGLRKYYRLDMGVWRPTVYQGRCIWKQSELKTLDESEIESLRRSRQIVDPIDPCDSARVAILKIMTDGKWYTSPDMIKILTRRGFNERTIRSAFHSIYLDRYLDVDKNGTMYQKRLKEYYLNHPEYLNNLDRLSYTTRTSS
jgi:hypothetical protein